jgi:hypothetical protein
VRAPAGNERAGYSISLRLTTIPQALLAQAVNGPRVARPKGALALFVVEQLAAVGTLRFARDSVLQRTVSVINTVTDTVTATIRVGNAPAAFGIFIPQGPTQTFAGTPGYSNCLGQSVAALAQQFGGLNAAALALGFSSVRALQNAILAFCGG